MVNKNTVKEGDYFQLIEGYSHRYRALQVMELWPASMTVKTKGGCMTKPYSEFKKIDDVSSFKELHQATWFENNL